MSRSIKQQMIAFGEFLEDKADGSMSTDKRGGKIYSSECARRELERRLARARPPMRTPGDSRPSVGRHSGW